MIGQTESSASVSEKSQAPSRKEEWLPPEEAILAGLEKVQRARQLGTSMVEILLTLCEEADCQIDELHRMFRFRGEQQELFCQQLQRNLASLSGKDQSAIQIPPLLHNALEQTLQQLGVQAQQRLETIQSMINRMMIEMQIQELNTHQLNSVEQLLKLLRALQSSPTDCAAEVAKQIEDPSTDQHIDHTAGSQPAQISQQLADVLVKRQVKRKKMPFQ